MGMDRNLKKTWSEVEERTLLKRPNGTSIKGKIY